MLSKLAIQEKLSGLMDRITEQSWFQELKGKWDELDPQSKNILRAGFALGGVSLVILLIFSAIWSVHQTKSELTDKTNLLHLIQSSSDELKQLRVGISPTIMTPEKEMGSWSSYIENTILPLGVLKENFSIANERPGQTTEHSKETYFEVTIKHINVKQLVKIVQTLEKGSRAVRLRNISVEEKLEGSGELDTTLYLSTFGYTGAVR